MSAVEQLFECAYSRVSRVFHSVRDFPPRFIDVCCFVLALAHRFSISSPLLSSVESELSLNAFILPLSPLQCYLVCHYPCFNTDSLSPAVQSFRGQADDTPWVRIDRFVQNGQLIEASEMLLQLLRCDSHYSLLILYDIILLTTKTDTHKVVPLQQLFLTQLESVNEQTLHHIASFVPLIRPLSLPSWSLASLRSFKAFFLQQMILIALHQPDSTSVIQQILRCSAPSVLFLSIRGFLQALTNNEDIQYLDGVTEPLLVWIRN